MPKRIDEDHKDFIDVYSGRIRKELKKYINNGSIFRLRGDGKKIDVTVPRIDIPHIVYGDNNEGIGRGEGNEGDVIGKDDPKGKGKGAGQGEADGVTISIDQEVILKFLKDELELPNLKSKPNQTYEEIRIKYNDIALTGPESLRHNKKTFLQAMKRMAASGELNKLHSIPGFKQKMKLVTPINADKRYRQYQEIKIPSSNAVIFFARDGSASMDEAKCDIVSDMAWWIDLFIRQYYKRVERRYIWHDSNASEIDEQNFYRYRYGGGTTCSSALKLISKYMENSFPPEKWNIYIFYFSDGENWGNDNDIFCDVIEKEFNPEVVNLIGITQVLAWNYQGSLKEHVDKRSGNIKNVRTTAISPKKDAASVSNQFGYGFYGTPALSEEERDQQIKEAIIDLLGAKKYKEN